MAVARLESTFLMPILARIAVNAANMADRSAYATQDIESVYLFIIDAAIRYSYGVKIKFLGAAGTVTGSSYLLTSGSGKSILIDLGMFQGPDNIDRLNFEPFDCDVSRLAGAVLTHAHLDHCGRLPIVMSLGFTGRIWMTPPTRDLTELSLLDSAKIAKEDDRKILYDEDLVRETVARFAVADFGEIFTLGDFTVTFRDAGHILGSAIVELVDNQHDSDTRKIVFSGDLGNSPEDLLPETERIDEADAVVMESTYGDRLHPDEDPSEVVKAEIQKVESSGGTLLIPAFSLERTQELLHIIMHLKKTGSILPQTPIYMDSPMGRRATMIYKNYPQDFNAHIKSDQKRGSAFDFPGLSVVGKSHESDAIHGEKGPSVIIAGSGMMTGGRILGHAMHYLPIPSTRLLIVGYQGEGTLGRQLLKGNKEVIIKGRTVGVMATVNDTQAMSSHADQGQLMSWLTHIKNVKKVVLTHGDDGPRKALSEKISEDLGITDVALPLLHQEIVLK